MKESTRVFGAEFNDDLGNFGIVRAGSIYRGRQPTEQGFRSLAILGVKTIVNLRAHPYGGEDELIKSLGMNQVLFPMVQIESPDAAKLKALIAQIALPVYPVYIHCAEGKDRTGAICGCIRATEGWDYKTEILPEMYSYGHNPIFEPMRGTIETFIKESAK